MKSFLAKAHQVFVGLQNTVKFSLNKSGGEIRVRQFLIIRLVLRNDMVLSALTGFPSSTRIMT